MTDKADTYEIVVSRVDQAHSILNSVLANDQFKSMKEHVLAGTLSASEELMGQARQGMEELWPLITDQPAKDAHSGDQDTVTTEALSEMVGNIHRAACIGRKLLDAERKRDKAAANEKPGEAS